MIEKNIYKTNSFVSKEMREKLNKHKSFLIWLTGLSGSGKSTLAYAIEKQLYQLGCNAFVLDGDNVRARLCSDLDFSGNDRKENIRRVSEVANLMMQSGTIAIVALISPFEADRNSVRNSTLEGNFIEIYCKASLEVCESRDKKGIYKLARSGQIKNLTGIDSPYEEPKNPELIIDTQSESLEVSITKIFDFLISEGKIIKNDTK